MLKNTMKKLMAAFVLVGFMGSASLPIIAEASSYHSENAQEQKIQRQDEEQRIQHQKEEKRIQRQQEKQRIQRQKEEQRRQHQRESQHKHHDNQDDNAPQHVGEGD
jgi:hypothetical protein